MQPFHDCLYCWPKVQGSGPKSFPPLYTVHQKPKYLPIIQRPACICHLPECVAIAMQKASVKEVFKKMCPLTRTSQRAAVKPCHLFRSRTTNRSSDQVVRWRPYEHLHEVQLPTVLPGPQESNSTTDMCSGTTKIEKIQGLCLNVLQCFITGASKLGACKFSWQPSAESGMSWVRASLTVSSEGRCSQQ